jgi:hypothetical protein
MAEAESLPTAAELRELVDTEVALRAMVVRLEGVRLGVEEALRTVLGGRQVRVDASNVTLGADANGNLANYLTGYAVVHMRGGRSKRVTFR